MNTPGPGRGWLSTYRASELHSPAQARAAERLSLLSSPNSRLLVPGPQLCPHLPSLDRRVVPGCPHLAGPPALGRHQRPVHFHILGRQPGGEREEGGAASKGSSRCEVDRGMGMGRRLTWLLGLHSTPKA